ncbi:unnamed protein product [Symbiodinium natans]|uniref:Endonuclease/exonuclease/phosphatase domain-containing protein n=1 Tax=Symbiodinium natans TaxID=878477 RepID=A0A812LX72_9DINO|nr:unnamed protein product [Symbiodinium natans]
MAEKEASSCRPLQQRKWQAHSQCARMCASVALAGPTSAFTVLTWNTLAPVYFRQAGFRDETEASLRSVALARCEKICRVLAASAADVVCLQEHWFDSNHQAVYQQLAQKHGYRYESLQRSGWNCDGRSEDGIAILVKEEVLDVRERHEVHFHSYGIPQDRVALLLSLSDRRRPGGAGKLAVMCTHLTFPHSYYDERSREAQIMACLDACERHASPDTALVFAGDFNGPSDDAISERLKKARFQNAWDEHCGTPCRVTHCDHRGNQFASDHIWLRGRLGVLKCKLLPEGIPDDAAMPRPVAGRAREGPQLPSSFEEWCHLSDHRPLLSELCWLS